MFSLNLFKKNNKSVAGLDFFVLQAQLSFKTVAQVSYKDEHGNTRIIRFFNDTWSKEVLNITENIRDTNFKIFVYTPNLIKHEKVKLSVSRNNEVIKSADFKIDQKSNYAGWFQLV